MSDQPSIFVIDSMAYIFRAFYGIRANMHSKDGLPTNALFGFINSFENIVRDFNPSHFSHAIAPAFFVGIFVVGYLANSSIVITTRSNSSTNDARTDRFRNSSASVR